MRPAALLLAAALAPLAASGQDVPVYRVGIHAETSDLSNGNADWTETGLRLSRQQGKREVIEAAVIQTRRFRLDDTQLQASATTALGAQLTGSLDLTFSDTHRVVPRHSVGARLQYEFRPAWLLHLGGRHARHDSTDVTQGNLMLEHYFGAFSAAAGWTPVHALGANANSYDLRGSWYYRDDGSVSLIASKGREAATVAGGAIVLAPVRSVALVGRQRVGGPWTATAAAFRTRQGDFYTRTGASVGLQREF